jgi:hypothetical protein
MFVNGEEQFMRIQSPIYLENIKLHKDDILKNLFFYNHIDYFIFFI